MHYKTLEFDKILMNIAEHALSRQAKDRLLGLAPLHDLGQCRLRMEEIVQARRILDALGAPPLSYMEDTYEILELCHKGAMLLPQQLGDLAVFIATCHRAKRFLGRAETTGSEVAAYGQSLWDLTPLQQDIERTVGPGGVVDSASPQLAHIRRKQQQLRTAIQSKMEELLRSRRECFSEQFVTTRGGLLVLPVKKQHKNQIAGRVVDSSSSGNTVFIQPDRVAKLGQQLLALEVEEDNEVRTILYTLSAQVDGQRGQLQQNMQCMEALDVVFAKAKYSAASGAGPVQLTNQRQISIKQGRHPLLDRDSCVPLDFEVGQQARGVVVTGPNTGGKTVALKTVGLLSLMAQCGLCVPAAAESVLCIHTNVLCDIGDGQSIAQNLSTFSAHITRIVEILQQVTHNSLVLLDELGSGTDPAEGMGIAVAILEELRRRGCLFVATTHYPEIKDFAARTPQLTNARMAFDAETLQPLFRLEMGEAGQSCALSIARRLGLAPHLLEWARQAAYGGGISPHMLQWEQPPQPTKTRDGSKDLPEVSALKRGDSVMVYPGKEIGIVYTGADARGQCVVQVRKQLRTVNHKRLKCLAVAEDLYPPDYDFSILFDSVANRKARHSMERKHDPTVQARWEKPLK